MTFLLDGREFKHIFLVYPLPTDAVGLLGTDFMEKVGATIDFGRGKMTFADVGRAPRAHSDKLAGRTALKSLQLVKRDTVLNLNNRRRGARTSRSQPAPFVTYLPRSTKN